MVIKFGLLGECIMDIILKDGTAITNVNVSDIKEFIDSNIINISIPNSITTNNLSGWPNQSAIEPPLDQSVVDEWNKLCKDNDKIPAQNYTGCDGTNYDAPGMELVKSLMNDKRVVNCECTASMPDVNFPDVNFTIGGMVASSTSAYMPYISEHLNTEISRADKFTVDPENNELKDEYRKYIDGLKQRKKTQW